MYSYQTRCKFCLEQHRPNQRCCIACAYCHEYHPKSQMIDAICPHLRSIVKSFQQKDQLTCRSCQGEGALEKEITTTLYQTTARYQKRLELYNAEHNNCDGSFAGDGDVPQRKIIKVTTSKEHYECRDCHGTGMIQKVMNCCFDGCHQCQFQRCKINPIWSSYHCENITYLCRCRDLCIDCSLPIEVGSKYCKMDCGHNYHTNCYIRDICLVDGHCIQCGYCQNEPNFSQCSQIQKSPEFENKHNIGFDLSLSKDEENLESMSKAIRELIHSNNNNSEIKIDCNLEEQVEIRIRPPIQDRRIEIQRQPIHQSYSMEISSQSALNSSQDLSRAVDGISSSSFGSS